MIFCKSSRAMLYWVWLLALAVNFTSPARADDEPKNDEAAQKEKGKNGDAPKTVAEIAEKCDRIEGLFTLLRDRQTGEVYLLVRKDQLGKEFIYFTYAENGIARLGLFRGNFRGERIFTIERDFRQLRFAFQPTRYYFDPNSPLRRAADANISTAVLAAEKIVGLDEEKGEYLVKADNMFLAEAFHQIKPSSRNLARPMFKLRPIL